MHRATDNDLQNLTNAADQAIIKNYALLNYAESFRRISVSHMCVNLYKWWVYIKLNEFISNKLENKFYLST
jgi:hypothetical protein